MIRLGNQTVKVNVTSVFSCTIGRIAAAVERNGRFRFVYRRWSHLPPFRYHMGCELKQTVPSLGREFTPVEIRIGWETPSWVAEAGIPLLFIRFRPQRFGNRLIRHGCQTRRRARRTPWWFENRMIRHGCQTLQRKSCSPQGFENRMIRLGCRTGRCSCRLPRRSHAQGPDRRHGASCRPFRAVGPLRTDWRTLKKERHRKPQK